MSDNLILDPIRIEYIWGHEDWCISAHPRADCRIRGGAYEGWTLSRLWQEHRELFGNLAGNVFPLLIKRIETDADVSIQVHPDDAYAKAHENGALGKSECWYILNLKPGTKTAILGHHAKDSAEAEQMVRGGRWQEFLNEVPVQEGSFLQIDPGTVHAVHGGTHFIETQQNSDVTYRLYDYGRLQNGKPRQLHVEQALACIRSPYAPRPAQQKTEEGAGWKRTQLVECAYYGTEKVDLDGSMPADYRHAFETVSVLSGEGNIGGTPVKEGTFLILPSGCGTQTWSGRFSALVSWPISR